jgi:hypothetical protein
MSGANYVALGGGKYPVQVFWDEGTQSIHLTCNDPTLTDENGEKPGFRTVFNANPRSADYNPANFNRLARHLREQGKPSPDEVPLHPRRLDQRAQVTAEIATAAADRPTGRPADPSTFGWATCAICASVVLDEPKHRAVCRA